jgi:phenylacetate-CoA ligase
MSDFLKSIPLVDHLVRRNPVYYGRFRRLLERTEIASLGERRELAARLLERSRRWAQALPGYSGLGLDRPLEQQPILTKRRLQEGGGAFRAGAWVPTVHAATGGSTGVPLQLVRSLSSLTMEQAMIDHLAGKAGVDLPRSRTAVVRADWIKDPNDNRPPFWRQAGPYRLLFSSNHLNAGNFPHIERALREFRPEVLLAFPSSLELLTDLAAERGVAMKVKLVITSSEMLSPGVRERAQDFFGAPVIDYYGMAERVCAAYSMEDGAYRFIFPYGYTELIKDSPGRYRIIGTSLWNRRQPLRRYETEDIALLGGDPSAEALERIGLGIDTFASIEGRISDYFLLADGSRLDTLDQVPKGVDGAATVQLIQEALDSALFVVVPNAQFTDRTLETIRRNFYVKAPRSIRVRVEVRDSPFRLANGKAPSFISQLSTN